MSLRRDWFSRQSIIQQVESTLESTLNALYLPDVGAFDVHSSGVSEVSAAQLSKFSWQSAFLRKRVSPWLATAARVGWRGREKERERRQLKAFGGRRTMASTLATGQVPCTVATDLCTCYTLITMPSSWLVFHRLPPSFPFAPTTASNLLVQAISPPRTDAATDSSAKEAVHRLLQ